MTLNKTFWPTFALAVFVCSGTLQAVGITQTGHPIAKPSLPIPGYQYISATRDGQTDHSLFYFNLFGFGDRIANADTLVIGSSHAEFGIDAAMLSTHRPFNIGLGGGEGLSFAATLLRKYQPHLSLIALDPFTPDSEAPSSEAATVLKSNRGVSTLKVLNIWSGFLRDWALQGLLPRVTISANKLTFENPIGGVIVRDWTTADVTAVYSSGGLYSSPGEVFIDSSRGHTMWSGPDWHGMKTELSLAAINATKIVVTTVPYPTYDDAIGHETADRLGARFVHIDAAGLRWWDYHHLNEASRTIVTEKLLDDIQGSK